MSNYLLPRRLKAGLNFGVSLRGCTPEYALELCRMLLGRYPRKPPSTILVGLMGRWTREEPLGDRIENHILIGYLGDYPKLMVIGFREDMDIITWQSALLQGTPGYNDG